MQVSQLRYRLLDVGGQRTERKKWLNCFGELLILEDRLMRRADQRLFEMNRGRNRAVVPGCK